jgi:hypothetical protein
VLFAQRAVLTDFYDEEYRLSQNECSAHCQSSPARLRELKGLFGGVYMADDMQVKREIVLEADAETLERMRKEGHARGFTVYCDEGERIGGDNTAPPPLAYFGLSVGF